MTCLCCILGNAVPLQAAGKADFVIIKNLSALTILNRFQQRLTRNDTYQFGSYAPFKVLKLDETLGDELTHAHRVSFRGKTYFLVLNEEGTPAGLPETDKFKVLKNCQVQGDTIWIRQPDKLVVRQGSPGSGTKKYPAKGTLLLRQFKYRGTWYLSSLEKKPLSGWSSLSPSSAWEKVVARRTVKKAVLNLQLQQRIREQFKKVNTAYQQYFDHFNRQTGENRAAPRWKCTGSSLGFTCTFIGSVQDLKDLEKSTRILMDGLQNMLLGKPFQVSLRNKNILIKPLTDN
jgi:hypothetical protein